MQLSKTILADESNDECWAATALVWNWLALLLLELISSYSNPRKKTSPYRILMPLGSSFKAATEAQWVLICYGC